MSLQNNATAKIESDPVEFEPREAELPQKDSYEEMPVSRHELKGLKHYFGLFAGEHVAGTEFAVGVTVVAWGVSTADFLQGLVIGNAAAVLLWTFFPALLGVRTRQTLYAFLSRVCGPYMQKIFNFVNGIVYCTMGGAMITISASAVRILFNIPPQVGLYPTNAMFVILVLAIGAVTTLVSIYGFDGVARFSSVCAPWLLVVFIMGGLLALPVLFGVSGQVTGLTGVQSFFALGDELVWIKAGDGLTKWHVAAFAVYCNLSLHVGLNDMAVFRYAKSYKYGYSVSLGVFFGHFLAWICSCMMGAAAAALLKTGIQNLDTGDISYSIMGTVGLLAVVIAGWTTANPNIYRSGLAFQNVFNRMPVRKVTMITGIITSIIACFPFIFSKLSEYVNIIGLAVTPVGAIVMCEYWVLPKLGMTRYWSYYRGEKLNKAALGAWAGGLIITTVLGFTGIVDFFFLFIPCFLVSCAIYVGLAAFLGARGQYTEEESKLQQKMQDLEKMQDIRFEKQLQEKGNDGNDVLAAKSGKTTLFFILSAAMLVICFAMAVMSYTGTIETAVYKNFAIIPTIGYFLFAIMYSKGKEPKLPQS